ncbi:MAG TPA: terminase family protein [Terriglobales bacterium]|nr:terminase family protein [Terriglobales bacterium]
MPDTDVCDSLARLPGWRPQSEPQRRALGADAELLLFGGAAGSLKSETLLVDAIREHANPNLRAILFRRSYPELEKTLIRRSRQLYPALGGVYHEAKRTWTFPSGATLEFAYCEDDGDVYRYQGAEYSWIGFDESTHFTEFPVRYLLSRLRSRGPGLQLRLRLASNPGNVGHAWHRALFMGGRCRHCAGAGGRPDPLAGTPRWPSDNAAVGHTVGFIPGSVRDHTLLNRDYVASLEALPGAFRRALLDGCWDVFEGQYFDHWRPAEMVLPRPALGDHSGWPHWIGADYGFNRSQAAAYLFTKSPARPKRPHGVTLVLDEYTARHQIAAGFARALESRWGRFRPHTVYLSPDAFALRGDEHSLADQMRQAAPALAFEAASTDRVGGAMLIYSQLAAGELIVADSCAQLLEAIPSRIHDPERPDDLRKIVGDPLDDCIDALRYGLYSYVSPPPDPRLSEFVFSSDPTVAAIQHRLLEHRRNPPPTRYLPRRPWRR